MLLFAQDMFTIEKGKYTRVTNLRREERRKDVHLKLTIATTVTNNEKFVWKDQFTWSPQWHLAIETDMT